MESLLSAGLTKLHWSSLGQSSLPSLFSSMESLMSEIRAFLKANRNPPPPNWERNEIYGWISEKLEQAEELIHRLNRMKSQFTSDLEKRKEDVNYFNSLSRSRYYWDREGYLADYQKS